MIQPRATELANVDQQQRVIDGLREEMAELTASTEQQRFLENLVDGLELHIAESVRYRLGAVHVPLLVGHGLVREPAATVDVATTHLALFIGIDLMDDAMDGDTSPYVEASGPAAMLVASTLLFALVPGMIARLPADPTIRCRLQERLSRCLLTMSEGQSRDVASFGRVGSPEAARAIVVTKSGEMLAAFAEMAAIRVGADDDTVALAGRLGRQLGVARQLSSDIFATLDPLGSSDLRNALPTMPIAHHLRSLPNDGQRAEFMALLAKSATSERARLEVRDQLGTSSGVLAATIEAELAAAAALQAIDDLNLDELPSTALAEMVEDASLLRHAERAFRDHGEEIESRGDDIDHDDDRDE